MSILIKNMTKPNDCYDCFFSDDELGCFFFTHDCPLVEVQEPHGDLVDKDKLMTDLIDSDLDHLQRDDWKEVIQIVEDAPTIIDAEGSAHEQD